MKTSNPNPTGGGHGATDGYEIWKAATTSDVHALQLGGGGGEVEPGPCEPSFWGKAVPYDWQIFGV